MDAIDEYKTTTSRMMTFEPAKIEASYKVLESMDSKPKVILELGTYVGNSAVAWGAFLKKLHSDSGDLSDCQVYCLELDPGFAKIARDFVDLAGLSSIVQVIEGVSSETIKSLQDEGKLKHIDMLFLDHWEKYYLPDLQLCEDLGLLTNGSVVIADNTDMPGAPDYLKYVKAGGKADNAKIRYESQTIQTKGRGGPVSLSCCQIPVDLKY
jgi:catechol O-methyltransferase